MCTFQDGGSRYLHGDDLTGKRFGLLQAVSYVGRRKGRNVWHCQCACGQTVDVIESSLKNGNTTSCGCKARSTDYLHFVDGTFIEAIERRTIAKNNTSGVRGVYWNSAKQLWIARIKFQKKSHYLGGYRTLEEAKKARLLAEEQLYDAYLQQYHAKKQQP